MSNALHGRWRVAPAARRPAQARASVPLVGAQLQAHAQHAQLVRALGGGPPPHAIAHYDSPAPPRTARLTRRVFSGEIELALLCAGRVWHAAGFGQSVSRALGTPRPLGCVLGLCHAPAVALAAASVICKRVHAQICVTLTEPEPEARVQALALSPEP